MFGDALHERVSSWLERQSRRFALPSAPACSITMADPVPRSIAEGSTSRNSKTKDVAGAAAETDTSPGYSYAGRSPSELGVMRQQVVVTAAPSSVAWLVAVFFGRYRCPRLEEAAARGPTGFRALSSEATRGLGDSVC